MLKEADDVEPPYNGVAVDLATSGIHQRQSGGKTQGEADWCLLTDLATLTFRKEATRIIGRLTIDYRIWFIVLIIIAALSCYLLVSSQYRQRPVLTVIFYVFMTRSGCRVVHRRVICL